MTDGPIPERGEIWRYLPTIRGRDKPSSLSGDRILILSRALVSANLPHVLAAPLESAPRMPGLAVKLTGGDPLPGLSVVAYRATPMYRGWRSEQLGTVSQATMRQVCTALVGIISE